MAVRKLPTGAAWAIVTAVRKGYLNALSNWSTAGKPVHMNVAHTGCDHFNQGLMSGNGILVGVIQPVPAALVP
jgi:hypothetical protein